MFCERLRMLLRGLKAACCDGLYKSMPVPLQDEVSDNP